ncbi:MAG: YIP1 family protein, partial [Mariprofundaceae bacterium]|nr:YIP1 family protein [Mariprofundaceae bacterium]
QEQPVQSDQPADIGNILAAIPGKMLSVILRPADFYRDMPKTGGFVEPLVFAVAMAVLVAVAVAILGMIGFGTIGMLAMGFFGVIVLPVMVAIGSFIGAGVIFVIWKLMGSGEDYETAYRCVTHAYAYAPVAALVAGIPYLGSLVQIAWPMALLAIASIEVHDRQPKLAWGVFGVLALLGAFSTLGAEYTARHLGDSLEGWSQRMEEKYGNPDDMTPEQAGKAVGEFLKGLEQMQQQGRE